MLLLKLIVNSRKYSESCEGSDLRSGTKYYVGLIAMSETRIYKENKFRDIAAQYAKGIDHVLKYTT
jgi:hypothetical protein